MTTLSALSSCLVSIVWVFRERTDATKLLWSEDRPEPSRGGESTCEVVPSLRVSVWVCRSAGRPVTCADTSDADDDAAECNDDVLARSGTCSRNVCTPAMYPFVCATPPFVCATVCATPPRVALAAARCVRSCSESRILDSERVECCTGADDRLAEEDLFRVSCRSRCSNSGNVCEMDASGDVAAAGTCAACAPDPRHVS